MTELEFEKVFSRAQELQTIRLTKEELEETEKVMRGFEVPGVLKKATIDQAAYIINLICMDIKGEYTPAILMEVREHYLTNVDIVDKSRYVSKLQEVGKHTVVDGQSNIKEALQDMLLSAGDEETRKLQLILHLLNEE